MTYKVFERYQEYGKSYAIDIGKKFSLAGWNIGLLYKAWEKTGKPVNEGWKASADELIRIESNGCETIESRLLCVDWNPKSEESTVLELSNVYAYTYSNNSGGAEWTPLILEMEDILDKKGEKKYEVSKRDKDSNSIMSILYLSGDDRGWKWGPSGLTAAAFIDGECRVYFAKVLSQKSN